MARTTKNATYISGPVRVDQRTDGRYRLVATVYGQQVERSGTRDLDTARERADAWASELGLPAPALNAGCYYKDLVKAYLTAPHEGWGKKNRHRLEGFARNHLVPALGGKRARNVNAAACQALLNKLADKGYSESLVGGVLTLMRSVAKHGRHTGVYNPSLDPLYGLSMPADDKFTCTKTATKPGVVLPVTAAEVPTVPLCDDLTEGLYLLRSSYGLMVELSVECGHRWGELIGASPEQWNAETRVFTIDRQLVEYDNGPAEWKLPKHNKVRAVTVSETLAPKLTAACEAALLAGRTHKFHDKRTGRTEERVLIFTGERGGWLRRSNFNRRVLRPAMDDCGWPETLTWHSLRHRFCVSMGALMEWTDVAQLAGHHSAQFTLAKYAQADDDVLERAKAAVAATGR